MNLINEHIERIKKLCQDYSVKELYVFGSVLSSNFRSDSDIDFLVQFSRMEPAEYFDNYMGFKDALGNLLARNIDLLEIQAIRNPILMRSIDRNKKLVYERKDSKMAV
jgi:uncharacterized protein